MIKRIFYFFFHLIIIAILTILTQTGGIIYLIAITISKIWKKQFWGKTLTVFLLLYITSTLLIVPYIAPLLGREKVSHQNNVAPANYMTVLLNRNYVRPELNTLLQQVAERLRKKSSPIQIRYLDANFPFIDQFPLLPHLSHNDGKKIDLALVYQTSDGKIAHQTKSRSGYGIFEAPVSGEFNQAKSCIEKGHLQYGLAKYLTFGSINKELIFSERGTQALIREILKEKQLGKLFLEPHLKNRLKLNHSKVRFHGCHSVRHDDHIHLQL